MDCCGKKRQQWLEEARARDAQVASPDRWPAADTSKPGVMFEYTGRQSLMVTGPATGSTYHFKSNGDRVEVEYGDSFALYAERDLRAVT